MAGLEQVVMEAERRCQPDKLVSIFLDFDGTLVPIEADPATPRLDAATYELLRLLTIKPSLVTTIISGRAVEDLYTRIRLEGLIYAGNHGLEIFGRNLCFVEPIAAALREKLAHLSEDLVLKLQPIAGALVEYKGLTTSVHYRNVAEDQIPLVQEAVRSTIGAVESFRVTAGRKVSEIVPRTEWHKGIAACWINRQLTRNGAEIESIYFGDDSTDENAFSSLNGAITVKVGGCSATRAHYHVEGPEEVQAFLDWLVHFTPSALQA